MFINYFLLLLVYLYQVLFALTSITNKKLAAYLLQNVAVSPSFCWLVMMFLAIDLFNRLLLLFERVDDSQTILTTNQKTICSPSDLPMN